MVGKRKRRMRRSGSGCGGGLMVQWSETHVLMCRTKWWRARERERERRMGLGERLARYLTEYNVGCWNWEDRGCLIKIIDHTMHGSK